MIAIYYGMIAYADSQMARLYQELDRRGLLENTWIIIGSDHGDYMGEKGLFMKTESLYECLLHVPLIIRPPVPQRAPRGEPIAGLVDMVDLFPTILNIARASTPDYAQGKDLLAWANTTNRSALHDCVFAQVGDYHGSNGAVSTFPSGLPAGGRHPGLLEGARTTAFSFTKDPDYGDEAYDLRADLRELRNLLGNKGAEPAEVAALRRRADEWREQCVRLRDRLGVIPGYRGWEEGQ
jgi:arylsulfatase A-like enzyme